jgi:hypothetical protein
MPGEETPPLEETGAGARVSKKGLNRMENLNGWGIIRMVFHVCCAICGSLDEQSTSYRAFEKLLRKQGWHKTQKFGWVCEYCWLRNETR